MCHGVHLNISLFSEYLGMLSAERSQPVQLTPGTEVPSSVGFCVLQSALLVGRRTGEDCDRTGKCAGETRARLLTTIFKEGMFCGLFRLRIMLIRDSDPCSFSRKRIPIRPLNAPHEPAKRRRFPSKTDTELT